MATDSTLKVGGNINRIQSREFPILPKAFAGWQQDSSGSKISASPADADAGQAAALKEYGFTDFQSVDYTKGDRKINIRAARFNDATGAYAAYTLYSQPG